MSIALTHPAVIDGWFKETGSMWPGQAFSLQVKQILHVEKSKYQDVLVFESTNWGNVLVLDGAIQCVEKDEFSYQEMLTHLPMASHPNPKRVLVIGGGDGGVCREVVKHPSVEEVILCDIDEAVPRVSKLYLPEMAKGLTHPKVTVYIGDGFEFLQRPENQDAFDVIITDSSDPEGPAEALFSRRYFELLKAALKSGGQLATQAECLWIHLPLITNLHKATKELFPVAEYAFTTIPSYPCGQIGFIVCSKDPSATVRVPKRQISGTKYYNSEVHKSSFILPEFAREALQETSSIKKTVSDAISTISDAMKGQNKILLLGSGFVTAPTVEYLSRRSENRITVACRTLAAAEDLARKYPRCTATSVDVNDQRALDSAIAQHDLVISLIPYTYHVAVIKSAIKSRKNVVTTSYVSPAMEELNAEAKAAGITVLNEVGLDPGIDHFYAVKTIDEVHQMGGKITSFLSYCGGLPAPEASDNPLGYKFSWSSRGVLLALQNSAKFYQEGKLEEIPGKDLMSFAKPYYITPAFAFVAYPNRDSTAYKERYNIPEAETVIRGTLRYQGFPQFIKALVELQMLDAGDKDYLKPDNFPLAWSQVMQKVTGASSAKEHDLLAAIRQKCNFSDKNEQDRIMAGFRWIGLFSESPVHKRGNLLDTLCATLEEKMQYGPGERDLVMLQHKFGIEWSDGRKETRTSTLEAYGEPFGASAMARTVGLPCGIATQLVLDGVITRKGICAPMDMEICAPIMKLLKEGEGISMVEKVV